MLGNISGCQFGNILVFCIQNVGYWTLQIRYLEHFKEILHGYQKRYSFTKLAINGKDINTLAKCFLYLR